METELEGLKALLELVDKVLLEESFKKAELTKPPEAPPTPPEAAPQPPIYEEVIPLKTPTGELLANLFLREDNIRVIPAEDKKFNVNTPPFTSFLVDRVLAKIQERDREAARNGKIMPDKIFSFTIVRDGDIIRELELRNVTPERFNELKSAIRWTFEKMWQKMSMKT